MTSQPGGRSLEGLHLENLRQFARNLVVPLRVRAEHGSGARGKYANSATPPALYGDRDDLFHNTNSILSLLYTDTTVFHSLESILGYVFTKARDKKWQISQVLAGDIEYRNIINTVFIHLSRLDPAKTQGKRGGGINVKSRTKLVSAVIMSAFFAEKLRTSGGATSAKIGILTNATRADNAMRGLVSWLASCELVDNGAASLELDRKMNEAWESVMIYLNTYLRWKLVDTPDLIPVTRIMSEMVGGVEKVVTEAMVQKNKPPMIPHNLPLRIASCIALGNAKTYPKGSSFSPAKNPCDSFLRSLLGYPGVDVFTHVAHDRLVKNSGDDWVRESVDPLTDFITGRRYNMVVSSESCYGADRRPTFDGGIHWCSHEATITDMFCGTAATVASGYSPLCPSRTFGVAGDPPCAWFPYEDCFLTGGDNDPAKADTMLDFRTELFWEKLSACWEGGSHALVEASLVTIRCEFSTVFNKEEAKISAGMLQPTWGIDSNVNSATTPDGKLVALLKRLNGVCSEYMAGPVAACAARLGCTACVREVWSYVEKRVAAYMSSRGEIGASSQASEWMGTGKLVSTSLRCLCRIYSILEAASRTQRHNGIRSICHARGYQSVLRFLLLERIMGKRSKSIGHDTYIFSSTLESILLSPTGRVILPLTTAWIGAAQDACASVPGPVPDILVKLTVAARLSRWVVTDMPDKGTGDIGTPETLSASLPFLDRMAIVCSIGTFFLCRLVKGMGSFEPSEEAWALLSEGVSKEIYEWDSTFVRRTMFAGEEELGTPHMLDMRCCLIKTDDKPDYVSYAKGYMSGLFLAHLTGVEAAWKQGQALPTGALPRGALDRFNGIMSSHLGPLGPWFAAHMSTYGCVYSCLLRFS